MAFDGAKAVFVAAISYLFFAEWNHILYKLFATLSSCILSSILIKIGLNTMEKLYDR